MEHVHRFDPFRTTHLPAGSGSIGTPRKYPSNARLTLKKRNLPGIVGARNRRMLRGRRLGSISAYVSPADAVPQSLLADDDADMCAYIGRLLGGTYEVEAVGDGQAALAAIAQEVPDLVLTGVMIPVMNMASGIYYRIRTIPATATIPVIMFIGASRRMSRFSRAWKLEQTTLVIKPFSAAQLLRASQVQRHAGTAA